MRRVAIALVALGAWACGPIDQSGTGAGAGGASDGGGGTGTDGGIAGGGGAPDGGSPAGGGAPADCGGVLPGDLGTAVTVTTPHGNGDVCWNATADRAGNVAAESHRGSMGNDWSGTWQVWSASGQPLGKIEDVGGGLFGQGEGFQAVKENSLVAWSPDGRAVRNSKLAEKCAHDAFKAATGGTLVLERCGAKMKAYRFDADGKAGASRDLGDGQDAAGLVDAQDRALILVAQGGGWSGRWYGAALEPVSDAFAIPGRGKLAILRPLIGGGAAIQLDGSWVATSASGAGSVAAPPEWLSSHANYDLEIVRQGRAYALIPRSGASVRDTLELFSGGGDRCGAVKFPVDGLSVGEDGTVIGSAGEAGCTHAIWSGLLR